MNPTPEPTDRVPNPGPDVGTPSAWAGKVVPTLTLAVLIAVAWWSLSTIERAKNQELANALETTLAANVTAMTIWFDDQKTLVTLLAHDPRVRAAAAELTGLRGPAGEDIARDKLLTSPAAGRLHEFLDSLRQESGYSGFVIVDRTGRAVAATDPAIVGTRTLHERVDAIARSLTGKTTVSRPFTSEVPLPDPDGKPALGVPTMLVSSPLRSANNEVIGALILRIRPEAGFTKILQVARFGTTGETYAVDDRGTLLSQSRFDDQIRPLGLLGSEPTSRSMLALEIRDPGGDMTTGFRPTISRREQPLTKMAAALAAGRNGTDVAGYNDYRGVPVAGAWEWLPEYHLGVTTEVDVDEAYQPLYLLRRSIYVLLGLLVISYGANLLAARSMSILASKAKWAERRVRQAELKARQLGQYTLEEKLGEGGMGAVYRASHSMLRRPTAIKLMSAIQPNVRDLLRFEREVQLTSRLNHPNTITIFDYGRTPEGIFYYAMEYLPGIDLDRLVRETGQLPEARVVHILAQIAAALQEAHAIGLIHRDIKPANLMLCERGGLFDFIKVLDFGLVREAESGDPSLTIVGSITGSPQYISPEAIRNANSADGRSDLYAVGAVAYFLLTGRAAFVGSTVAEILADHLSRPLTTLSQSMTRPMDPILEQLIVDCLAKNPSDRPANAAEFLDRLRKCASFGRWSNENARQWWHQHKSNVNLSTDGPIVITASQDDNLTTVTVARNGAEG